MVLKVGLIGCGGRGREHALGYGATDKAKIVALADPNQESAQKLAEQYGVENIYGDYHEMLQQNQLDMVSVCTWTGQHRDQVLAAIEAGVRAIHCEKPMAPTYGEARAMHEAATRKGVQLTFCHQRRFHPQFQKMRELIEDGAIGDLRRMEGRCPNLFDWGTHWFDMFFFLNRGTAAKSVLGQIDLTDYRTIFGTPVDSQGLSMIEFENEVTANMETGRKSLQNFGLRAEGSKGILEAHSSDSNELHLLQYGKDWEFIVAEDKYSTPVGDSIYTRSTVESIIEAIDCLEKGRESLLSTHKSLRATELIFATYESSRRRGRVDLPLDIEDSPLIAAVEEMAK